MDEERSLGVTEARFGLTILICLLVAIGYVVLLRLGNSTESVLEVRPEPIARQAASATPTDDDPPKVLEISKSPPPRSNRDETKFQRR